MANYYWIKLKKDFYKRHDIRLIEAMPNGVDYIWFYMKLMMESVDHQGQLRFSEFIPYDNNMLSVITNTNIDTVKSAMDLFNQLGMIEIMDDKTIFMIEVDKIIGKETGSAERVRRFRAKEIELKTIEEDEPEEVKEKKNKYGSFKKVLLTLDEYERLLKDYPNDALRAIEFLDAYIAEKGYKSKSHNLAIRRWVMEAINKSSKGKRIESAIDYDNNESQSVTMEDIEEMKKALHNLGAK